VPHCAHFSSFTRFHFLCICYAIRRAIPVNNFLGMLSHLDYLWHAPCDNNCFRLAANIRSIWLGWMEPARGDI
jgi:uncharacterized membrane protein YjjB (DUF3815 family)